MIEIKSIKARLCDFLFHHEIRKHALALVCSCGILSPGIAQGIRTSSGILALTSDILAIVTALIISYSFVYHDNSELRFSMLICRAGFAIITDKIKNKDYFNISRFFINHLPEESQGYLLDLRKRWQNSGKPSFLVALKTMHFWVRHWGCDICSEIGKRVHKAFPSRWI
jgi:hypothetical protein